MVEVNIRELKEQESKVSTVFTIDNLISTDNKETRALCEIIKCQELHLAT